MPTDCADPQQDGRDRSAGARALPRTRRRILTRRGVIWLGQTCNLRCYFCYFVDRIKDAHHPEHPFMSLEKAKEICKTLREFYGCTSVDIQGGEPTIHPHILDLIAYCREIGLYPTLITNGIYLAKPGVLAKFQEAGIRDFLVSLHGIGEVHDQVVGRKKSYEKIITSIEGMRDLGIPFRFNCTMSEPVVPLLPQIAGKAIEYGALAVNFIAFNPFADQQQGVRTGDNVPRYADLKGPLAGAIDLLEEADIECNVRYLPMCMAEPRHRKNFYNYQQLSYDTHEWDFQSWLWTMMQPQMMRDGCLVPAFRIGGGGADNLYRNPFHRAHDYHSIAKEFAGHPVRGKLKFAWQHVAGRLEEAVRGKDTLYRKEARDRAALDCGYKYHDACSQCALREICDGFHGDYADFFGTDEARPITDMTPTDDPLLFIREQEKIVEEEDVEWAL